MKITRKILVFVFVVLGFVALLSSQGYCFKLVKVKNFGDLIDKMEGKLFQKYIQKELADKAIIQELANKAIREDLIEGAIKKALIEEAFHVQGMTWSNYGDWSLLVTNQKGLRELGLDVQGALEEILSRFFKEYTVKIFSPVPRNIEYATNDAIERNWTYVLFGTGIGDVQRGNIYDVFVDRVKRGELYKVISENQPEPPTAQTLREDKEKYIEYVDRVSKLTAGKPIPKDDINELGKRNPLLASSLAETSIKTSLLGKTAGGMVSEAAADIEFAETVRKEVEKMAKSFALAERSPTGVSSHAVAKDQLKALHLQIELLSRILKEVSHTNMLLAQIASRYVEKERATIMQRVAGELEREVVYEDYEPQESQ